MLIRNITDSTIRLRGARVHTYFYVNGSFLCSFSPSIGYSESYTLIDGLNGDVDGEGTGTRSTHSLLHNNVNVEHDMTLFGNTCTCNANRVFGFLRSVAAFISAFCFILPRRSMRFRCHSFLWFGNMSIEYSVRSVPLILLRLNVLMFHWPYHNAYATKSNQPAILC